MLHADVDHVTPETIQKELNAPKAALVRSVDLQETSFNPGLRALASGGGAYTAVDEKKLVEQAREQGPAFAETVIRTHLQGIASKLDDAKLRERYLDEKLPMRDMLTVLNHASSADLQNFSHSLYTLSLANKEVRAFTADKFDNALHYYNVFEKHSLIDRLLKEPNKESANAFIAMTLRSSENQRELVQLVNGTGAAKLIATGSAEVKEYVAQAVLGPVVQAITLPANLAPGVAHDQTERALDQIKAAHEKVIQIVSKHELADTRVAKDFVKTAEDALKNLAMEREEQVVRAPVAPLAPTAPTAPTAPKPPSDEDLRRDPNLETTYKKELEQYQKAVEQHQKDLTKYNENLQVYQRDWARHEEAMRQYHKDLKESRENLRQISNTYRGITELEYRYGVNITYGSSEFLGFKFPAMANRRPEGRWTEQDVADVRAVLEGIPENHVIHSPMLREIQRVPSLGWGVLGARFDDGVIKIADMTINHAGVSREYEGKSSLQIVLAHEIGHGIQIGAGPSWFAAGPDGKQMIEVGESRYDFDEFYKMGGWAPVERNRWQYTFNGVRLDGKEVEVGVPIEVNGQRIVLVPMGRDALLQFNPDADFSSRWYAKASPWEDFAEAFSEYIFLPERLIKFAPEKFKHLEQEFHKYDGDARIQDLLNRALEERKNRQQQPLPQMQEEWRNQKKSPWIF